MLDTGRGHHSATPHASFARISAAGTPSADRSASQRDRTDLPHDEMATKPRWLIAGGMGMVGRNVVKYLIDNNLASDIRIADKRAPFMAFLKCDYDDAAAAELPCMTRRSARICEPWRRSVERVGAPCSPAAARRCTRSFTPCRHCRHPLRSADHRAAIENPIVEVVQADLADDDHLDKVLGAWRGGGGDG